MIKNSTRQAINIYYKNICQYCGCVVGETWHIDHIIPKSKGGKDKISNLTLSCAKCNMAKSDIIYSEKAKELIKKSFNGRKEIIEYSIKVKSFLYLIRDIPDDLWQAARHHAVEARITLRELIIRALKAYLGL